MVTTPTVWKAEHQADTGTGANSPFFADIGFGRYVSVWFDNSLNRDVRGVIRDAEASVTGGDFLVNQTHHGSFEVPASAVSRPGGGFFALYIAEAPNPTQHSLYVESYDSNGAHLSAKTIISEETVSNAKMSVAANGSYLATYSRKNLDSSTDIVAKLVDANGNVGSELTIFDSGDDANLASHVAALSNGKFIVVYQDLFSEGDNDVWFRIVNANGSLGATGQVIITTDDELEMRVAALEGGGFVVAWTDSNDGDGEGIRCNVFGSAGNLVSGSALGGLPVNATIAGDQQTPDVVGLKDGGFVVVWDDDERGGIYGRRFDATGAAVGNEFAAGASDLARDPTVARLSDGRFIVGFADGSKNHTFATIFDPREKTINGTSAADVLTSRIDGATVNGLGGADTLLGQSGADTLNGGTGADTMRGRGGGDTYIVDNAGDKVIESANQGTDLVKASVSFTLGANVENLTLTGTAAINGTGNTLANIIIGNAAANRINGGIGPDTLTGGAGPDTFVFDASLSAKTVAKDNPNADTITDFSPADDTIELAASVFPKLKLGVLKAKAFGSGGKKPSRDKHLVYYDKKDGDLWYDADGHKHKGKGDVLVAHLEPHLDMTHADIVVA